MVERRGCVLGRRACVQGALLWGGNGENCDAVAPACCSFFFLFFFFAMTLFLTPRLTASFDTRETCINHPTPTECDVRLCFKVPSTLM